MKNRTIHAYQQAPWRVQTQWLGLFLLALLLIASVAGIYLDISARAAKIGRDIQGLDAEAEATESRISGLRTQLATLTSSDEMQKRIKALGFVPVEAGSVVYLPVSGYVSRQPAMLAPVPSQDMAKQPLLEPRYTQSLLEWLFSSVITSPDNSPEQVLQ
jgi:cell division protein FtsB